MIHVCGLDLGKQRDYSALVIVEAHGTVRPVTWQEPHSAMPQYLTTRQQQVESLPVTALHVRHCERFPLQTPYQTVREATDAWLRSLSQPRYLAVDHTGPGIPVAEIFGSLTPAAWVTLTTGSGTRRISADTFHLAKKDLVAGGQVALEQRMLKIARALPYARELESELRNYQGKPTPAGNVSYEAQRESDHDDLVSALCLAVWLATQAFGMAAIRADETVRHARAEQLYRDSRISPI